MALITACVAVVLLSCAACGSTDDSPPSPSVPATVTPLPTLTAPAGNASEIPALMRTATARAGKPEPQMTIIQVQPGHEAAALKTASQRVGFTIKTPGYLPEPATQLIRVFTNEAIHKDNPNVGMNAQLFYVDPGDTANPPADTMMVIEDTGHYTGGPSDATPVATPSGASYKAWVEHYPAKPNIPFAAVYTFMTSNETTTLTFSLQKPVTDQQVVKMYQSLK